MKKTMPRPFRTLLTLLLILLMVIPLSSCSAETLDSFTSLFNQQNTSISKLLRQQHPVEQPGVLISDALSPVSYENQYGYQALDDSQKPIYDAIHTAVLNYYRLVDLRKTPLPINEFMRIFYYYIDDHPEVFWVNPHIETFFYDRSEEECISVILQYRDQNGSEEYDSEQNEILNRIPDADLTRMREDFNKEINQILALLSADDDDLQRELKIFNHLAQTVTYDHDLADAIVSSTVNSISQSAYGAVIEHKTVCTGYAKLFALLANAAGLECLSQYGVLEGVGHQWNIVSINGAYYHVDATDPVITYEDTTIIDYTYLNATDQDIQKTHTFKPSSLTESNYQVSYDTPPCTAQDNTYATLFGIKVSSGAFNRSDFQEKIKRLHHRGLTSLCFSFPPGAPQNTVQRFFDNNFAQMERLASGAFNLGDEYYYFETTGRAYVNMTLP